MDELMVTASRLIAAETRRVEVAAQNVANASTAGYRSQRIFQDGLIDGAAARGSVDDLMRVVPDLTPGKLVHTGNAYDLAIEGDGFFVINTDHGIGYVRGGAFHKDDQSRLVTLEGWPLQAAGGGDLSIDASGDWRLNPDGSAVGDESASSAMRIARFSDPSNLHREGGVFYSSQAPDDDDGHSRISQGYLESSNVVMARDMVSVMESMRRVESGQKIVHAYDDMMGSVLQRLGEM